MVSRGLSPATPRAPGPSQDDVPQAGVGEVGKHGAVPDLPTTPAGAS